MTRRGGQECLRHSATNQHALHDAAGGVGAGGWAEGELLGEVVAESVA